MATVPTERQDGESLKRLLPKRDRIKATLRVLVQTLPPGAALPSIAALRQQFGVSQHTIDRVIGDLRAEGLLETRRRSGIYVVEPERALTIGILSNINLLSPESGFYGLLAMALHHCATPNSIRFRHYFLTSQQDASSYGQLRADAQAGELNGMIGLGVGGYLDTLGIPFLNQTSWHMDGGALVRLAVEALVVRGRRRLGLLSHGAGDGDGAAEDRFGERTVFQMAAAQAGAMTTAAWMRPFRTRPELQLWGHDEFSALWDSGGERPDGIVSLDDHATMGMLFAAERLNIAIPEVLMVASHANSLSPLPDPAKVIRVEYDTMALAQGMLAKLQARIAGREAEPSALWVSPRVAENSLIW